jgi:hypothetical protein
VGSLLSGPTFYIVEKFTLRYPKLKNNNNNNIELNQQEQVRD